MLAGRLVVAAGSRDPPAGDLDRGDPDGVGAVLGRVRLVDHGLRLVEAVQLEERDGAPEAREVDLAVPAPTPRLDRGEGVVDGLLEPSGPVARPGPAEEQVRPGQVGGLAVGHLQATGDLLVALVEEVRPDQAAQGHHQVQADPLLPQHRAVGERTAGQPAGLLVVGHAHDAGEGEVDLEEATARGQLLVGDVHQVRAHLAARTQGLHGEPADAQPRAQLGVPAPLVSQGAVEHLGRLVVLAALEQHVADPDHHRQLGLGVHGRL